MDIHIIDDIMNTFFFLVTFLTTAHLNGAAVQDLSGSYSFENCVCTVLRCLKPSPYQVNQSPNGHFTIYLWLLYSSSTRTSDVI